MKKFMYRKNTEIVGELLEENDTYYVVGFGNDMKALEKELTTMEDLEMIQIGEYEAIAKHQTIHTNNKGEKILVSRFDTSGKPRSNGRFFKREKL